MFLANLPAVPAMPWVRRSAHVLACLGAVWIAAAPAHVRAQTFCEDPGLGALVDHAGADVFLLQNTTWTGRHCNIGTLTVGEFFTLQATPGAPLLIEAERVNIAGHVSADEAGGPGGAAGGRGGAGVGAAGSGGGATGTDGQICPAGNPNNWRNAGGGGGGAAAYAGTAGVGGHGSDASDDGCQGQAGGAGGATWGTTETPQMGAGGGGGAGAGGPNFDTQPATAGERGGGRLIVLARTLELTGRVSADGGQGGEGGSSPDLFHGGGGGGGAAGGGIHLRASILIGDGVVSARGGNGGDGGEGTIRGLDYYQGAGGGGGGGGRILIERADGDDWSGTTDVTGGLAGNGHNTNIDPDGAPDAATAGGAGNVVVRDYNGAPTADAGGPYVAGEGIPVELDGSDSSDPNEGDDLAYEWDVDCNGSVEATGVAPSIAFDDDAVDPYAVCLTVSDGEFSHTATAFAIIFDLPPTGIIVLPEDAPDEGETFSASAAESYADGGDGSIDDSVVSFEWDWDYLSTFEPSGDTGVNPSHAYDDNGLMFVALRVTDEDGGSSIAVAPFEVLNVAPEIVSEDWPTSAVEGQVWTYPMQIEDPGTADTHTFEVLTGPDGMSADPESGVFTWTPTYVQGEQGSVNALLSVIDKDFGRDTQAITVSVTTSDRDSDGMPDGWEARYELDPDDETDAGDDEDVDGVTNLDEYLRDTSPRQFDGPTAPRLASPPRGYEVGVPVDLVLAVFQATHPFGEPLTYRFAVYATNPEDDPLAEPIAEADFVEPGDDLASFQVQLTAEEVVDNTRYYWRAWAHDGLVYGPPSEVGDFFVNAEQDCPTAPTLLSPVDGGFVSVTSPLFVLQNATDLDGDRLVYVFVLYGDEQLLSAVTSSGVVEEGVDGTTSWAPEVELDDATEYFWRARAIDGEGCASPFTDVFSFFTTFDNEAPSAPIIILPEEGSTIGEARPAIIIQNAVDPNRDPLAYVFEIDRSQQFDTLDYQTSGEIDEETVSSTSWEVEDPLVDDTLYYVRVHATDGELDGPYATGTFLVNHTNDLPSAPIPISPVDGGTVSNNRPRMLVENARDPDGETLVYHFQLYADPALTELVAERDNVPESFENSFWRVNTSLLAGPYWWRARAIDHSGEGMWSEAARYNIELLRDLPGGEDVGNETPGGTPAGGDEGCGCGVAPAAPELAAWLGLLALAVMARRRR